MFNVYGSTVQQIHISQQQLEIVDFDLMQSEDPGVVEQGVQKSAPIQLHANRFAGFA